MPTVTLQPHELRWLVSTLEQRVEQSPQQDRVLLALREAEAGPQPSQRSYPLPDYDA